MVTILATPLLLCFPRQGLREKVPSDQWSDMVLCKSDRYSTVSGRLPLAASLTVLGKRGELKNWKLEKLEKTKECSSIHFLLREFC